MNTENFWKLVATLNWTQSQDYNKHKAYIIKNYSPKEVTNLYTVYHTIYNQLATVLQKQMNHPNSKYRVSDDGFSDLCSEIIGRGEEFYNIVMNDPCISQKMIETSDYHESFSYCIPHNSDYAKLSLDYYLAEAKSHLETINEEADWDIFNNEIQELKSKYANLIQGALDQYRFKDLVAKEYEIIGMQKELEKKSKVSLYAGLTNAISDYKLFML